MKEKVIITAAITGSIHTPAMSHYLPITPKQIANDAVAAYEAEAANCHIHVRDPQTGRPTPDVNLIREVVTSVKKRCDMIVCITTGGGLGMTAEQRLIPVSTFKPELASFNAGSLNFALFHVLDKFKEKGIQAKGSAEQVVKIARLARELGIELASPDEARKILGLKGVDKVNF